MNWTTIALLAVVGAAVISRLPYLMHKIVEINDNRDFRNMDK